MMVNLIKSLSHGCVRVAMVQPAAAARSSGRQRTRTVRTGNINTYKYTGQNQKYKHSN